LCGAETLSIYKKPSAQKQLFYRVFALPQATPKSRLDGRTLGDSQLNSLNHLKNHFDLHNIKETSGEFSNLKVEALSLIEHFLIRYDQ
jgi:hypothetical protein